MTDYARFLRDTINEVSNGKCGIFLQSFPPPLNVATGFDSKEIEPFCTAIGIKFYTMHWPVIEADFLKTLADRANFPKEETVLFIKLERPETILSFLSRGKTSMRTLYSRPISLY